MPAAKGLFFPRCRLYGNKVLTSDSPGQIRCDAQPPDVCSRCQHMGLHCTLTTDAGVRQSKAQLQRELEMLREKSEAVGSGLRRPSFSHAKPPSVISIQASDPPHQPPLSTALSYSISPVAMHDPSLVSAGDRCSVRALDGQDLEASKIQDCFDL